MRSQIKLVGGKRLKRNATISENAQAKRTLKSILFAIKQGRLDDIITLSSGIHKKDGQFHFKSNSISELDEQIKTVRESKMDDVQFALDQMDLFSQYLKKNVHAANSGYGLDMILQFISKDDLYQFVDMVMKQAEKSKTEYVPGKYRNVFGGEQSLLDHVVSHIENEAYENQTRRQNNGI